MPITVADLKSKLNCYPDDYEVLLSPHGMAGARFTVDIPGSTSYLLDDRRCLVIHGGDMIAVDERGLKPWPKP